MKGKKGNTTVHDIARKLKVSASTVSRALNNHPKISEATKSKVKEMALSLGYAQNISSALRHDLIGKTVGIVIPSLNQSKYALMVESCRKMLEEKGFQVLVCCTSDQSEKEKDIVKLLSNLDVDGICLSLSAESKDLKYIRSLAISRPLVLFDRISFDVACNKVMIDHFQAGFRAVQHLLNIGCRKIAHIGGNLNCLLTKQISAGYKTATRNSGLSLNPKMELFSDYLYDDVVKAVDMLLKLKENPDAIIVDDIMATQKLVSVLLTRQVKIPEEIAIVAIGDDRDYSYYSPSITTIKLPYRKMGKEAAVLLLSELEKNKINKDHQTTVVPFDLNIRNSTLRK